MVSGYFGKLPQRADFVTLAMPPGFARVWEPFVEQGLSQSRAELGDAWDAAYMTMPAWHYQLTPAGENAVLRTAVAGVFIPSIDAVERRYPLTIVSALDEVPAPRRAGDQWHARAEAALLSVLDDEATFEAFQDRVRCLGPAGIGDSKEQDGDEPPLDLATGPEVAGDLRSLFWCTAGGRSVRFGCEGMPAAGCFRHFLLPEALQADGAGIRTAALAANDDDLEARS